MDSGESKKQIESATLEVPLQPAAPSLVNNAMTTEATVDDASNMQDQTVKNSKEVQQDSITNTNETDASNKQTSKLSQLFQKLESFEVSLQVVTWNMNGQVCKCYHALKLIFHVCF